MGGRQHPCLRAAVAAVNSTLNRLIFALSLHLSQITARFWDKSNTDFFQCKLCEMFAA
jgi:hypothetical protein